MTSWWLRAEDGTRVRIEGGGALLGRAADCDVVLPDERASRRQALVYAAGARAAVVQLGRAATRVDGEVVEGEREVSAGARVEVPGLTLVLESEAVADAASREWLVQRDGGGLFGVARSPFVIGAASDDLELEGWPAGALVLTAVDGAMTIELGVPARLAGRELPAGSVEPCEHGTTVELAGVQIRLLGGHVVGEGTTVSRPDDAAAAVPVRVRLEFLPRGARLHLTDGRGDHVAYLPERRAELVSLLLAPPEPYAPGDLVPDEVVIEKLWPRQSKTNNDLHVLVHRVRKSLVAAGLDGVRLVAREPRTGGTTFELAPGAVVRVE